MLVRCCERICCFISSAALALALLAGCHGTIEQGPAFGDQPGGTAADIPGRPGADGFSGSPAQNGSSPQRPGSDPTGPSDACTNAAVATGPSRMRRLQPDEYASTARALLEDAGLAPHLEPQASEIITALEVEALNTAANELAAGAGHERYAPCDLDGAANAACAREFVDAFGKVAFRRPLEEDERTWLLATYEKLLAAEVEPAFTFREAIAGVAEVILQAPQHVYVHERGVAQAALPSGVRQLTGYERATRLSYLLSSSTPDAELMRAADAGELDTAEGVRAQAERLLEAPSARAMVRDFASRWLRLNDTPQHPALEKAASNPTTRESRPRPRSTTCSRACCSCSATMTRTSARTTPGSRGRSPA